MGFKLFEVVKVKNEAVSSKITSESIGTIIEILREKPKQVFEVEFIDANGKLVEILTLKSSQVERLNSIP